jgi:hypothetical protein
MINLYTAKYFGSKSAKRGYLRRSIPSTDPHSNLPNRTLLVHRLERLHRLLKVKFKRHNRLDIVRVNELRKFGQGVAREGTASFHCWQVSNISETKLKLGKTYQF